MSDKLVDKPIRTETKRVRIISDGQSAYTQIVDTETGDPVITPYRVEWRLKAQGLATIHIDAYLAAANIEGEAEIAYHDQAAKQCSLFQQQIQEMIKHQNAVYTERNQCVALIARMALALGYKAGIGQDLECEEEWQNVIYIDLPNGQVSWHIPASELSFFDFLPVYEGKWDGHSNTIKYARVLNPGI